MIRRLRRQRRFLDRVLLALLALALGGVLLAPCTAAMAVPAHSTLAQPGPQSNPQIGPRCGETCPMPHCAGGSGSQTCTQGCATQACATGHTPAPLAAATAVPAAHIAPALHALAMPAYGASPRVIPFPPAADRPPPRPVPHQSFAILLL
jgi:hypothetical protein